MSSELQLRAGPAVNVLSEETYSALKRESRGDRYPLRPNDLHLTGVGGGQAKHSWRCSSACLLRQVFATFAPRLLRVVAVRLTM